MKRLIGVEGLFDYHAGWVRIGRRWLGFWRNRFHVVPVIAGGTSASTTQEAFWFRNDNGSLTTATYIGSQDTNYSTGDLTANYKFRIRIIVEEQNGKNDPWAFQLGAQKNGTGGYTLITTSRSDGIRYADDANSIADGSTIATADFDLTYTGTAQDGEYDDAQTSAGTGTIALNGTYCELEFCLEAVFADYNDTDYFDFQVLDTGGGAIDGYTVTPRITLNKGAVTHTASAALAGSGSLTAAGSIVWSGVQVDVDLETGDLTQFDTTTNPTDMSATGAAAQNGSYGLQVDLTSAAGTDTHGNMTLPIGLPDGNQINMRAYIDDNTLSLGVGDTLDLAVIRTDGSVGGVSQMGRISIRNNSGTIQLQGLHETDAGATGSVSASSPSFPLYVEIELKRASSDVAADGTLELFINGVSAGTDTRDNYDIFTTISGSRLGADSNQATTSGVIYLDDWVISNSRIGAVATGISGAAVLSGSASVAAIPAITRTVTAALAGSASVAAVGTLVTTHTASAALNGSASLAAIPAITRAVQAALDGSASLAAIGKTAQRGAAALDGSASVTAAPAITRAVSALLAGSGSMASIPSVVRSVAALLAGNATLAAVGAIQGAVNSGAILAGSAAVQAIASITRAVQALLAGTATLTASGSTGATLAGQASLDGSASLTAAPSITRSAAAIIAGSGAVVSTGSVTYISAANLAGAATVTASASLLGTVTAAAALDGTATLSAIPAITRTVTASLAGSASLEAIAQNLKQAQAAMNASASLAGLASVEHVGLVLMAGSATLTAVGGYHYDVVYTGLEYVSFVKFRERRAFVKFKKRNRLSKV